MAFRIVVLLTLLFNLFLVPAAFAIPPGGYAPGVDGIDEAGGSEYYGTDAGGNAGFHALPAGTGDVIGPAAAVVGNVPTFNNVNGKVIQDSGTALSALATDAEVAAGYQPLDAGLTSIAGLTTAADRMIYTTAADTYAVATLSAFARTILDDADAATVQATLGLVPGTNIQAQDAELAALAGLTSAADKAPYFTGSGTAALADLTAYARTILDDADAATARATLGLVIGTDVQAQNAHLADLADGALTGSKLDVMNLTAESTADDADTILIYDDSASGYRRMTRGNFIFGLGGGGGAALDLLDDGSNESSGITEIAVIYTATAATIATEPSANKLLFDFGLVGTLSENETITGNWVNTTNPWADNEVADALTIAGGTVNNSIIGGSTPAAGTFTTLTANSTFTVATGQNIVLGANTLNSGDLLDGTKVADADLGDVGVSSGAWAVEDDSHAHTNASITLASTDLSDTAAIGYLAGANTWTGNNVFGNADTDTLTVRSRIIGGNSRGVWIADSTPTPSYATSTDDLYVGGVVECAVLRAGTIYGGSTAWDDIGDPDAAGTVAFGGYAQTLTSSLDAASGYSLTLQHTAATIANDIYLLRLLHTSNAEEDSHFLIAADASGTKMRVDYDGSVYATSFNAFRTASHQYTDYYEGNGEAGDNYHRLIAQAFTASRVSTLPDYVIGFPVSTAVDASGYIYRLSSGTAPTVDAAGEISVDTTDDQLVYYSDEVNVINPVKYYTAVIEDLAAVDDNFEIAMFNDAVTIVSIGVHCRGTCTTGAQISLEDRAGNAMTHTTPTASTGTGATTFQSVTANNALTAGEGLCIDVDNAVSPETDVYTITVGYRDTRQ